MHDVMHEINERTNQSGTNKLEVLMFRLTHQEGAYDQLFGINVFKVKELLTVPTLRHLPMAPDYVKGLANIRGTTLPVIDLIEYCGFETETHPNILIHSEYNNASQGLLVHDVDNIVHLDWSDVLEPPKILTGIDSAVVTGVSELDDKRLL